MAADEKTRRTRPLKNTTRTRGMKHELDEAVDDDEDEADDEHEEDDVGEEEEDNEADEDEEVRGIFKGCRSRG